MCSEKCYVNGEEIECICDGVNYEDVFKAYDDNSNDEKMVFSEFDAFFWDVEVGMLRPIPDDGPDGGDGGDGTDDQTDQQGFNNWVSNRTVLHEDYGHCNMDIYTEWHNSYYLFAGHNCDIYDLKLKLYISKNDWDNQKKWMNDFPEDK